MFIYSMRASTLKFFGDDIRMKKKFMIAKIMFFCAVILALAAFVSCNSGGGNIVESTTSGAVEEVEPKYLGTLKLEEINDGKNMNIS